MTNTLKFYINGEWIAPKSLKSAPVINPATEESIAELAMGSPADVSAAVAAAPASKTATK